MNNDKISERLDEHEKRIFFNNSFAKNKTDELQTSLNELETAVETATTSVETIQTELETAETSLSELETTVETTTTSIETIQTELETAETSLSELETLTQTHTSEIAELTTENETSTANITNLQTAQTQTQTALTTAQNSITNLQTNLGTAETSITNLQTAQTATQTALDTAEETITDHETRITTLENSPSMPDYYGTRIEEITNLAGKCAEEPFFNNGDSATLELGFKYANGPKCILFTRVNPFGNVNFTGTIKFEFSNIPANQTNFAVNIWKNGTQIETATQLPLITGQTHQAEYSFDFPASEITAVSQVFKIEFADPLLAEMILDRITITATSGRNFMVLNRNESLTFCSYRTSTEGDWRYFVKKVGNNYYYKRKDYNPENTITFPTTKVTFISNITDHAQHYYINPSLNLVPNNFYISTYKKEFYILGENDILKFSRGGINILYEAEISNVNNFHFDPLTLSNINYIGFCGTTNAQEIFITTSIEKDYSLPTLNGENIPTEFVQCIPVNDFMARLRTTFGSKGYLFHHNTGHMLYFPSKNSNYFIDLGIGNQPQVNFNEAGDKITITYEFCNKIFQKMLYLNSETNNWHFQQGLHTFWEYAKIIVLADDYGYQYKNNQWSIIYF